MHDTHNNEELLKRIADLESQLAESEYRRTLSEEINKAFKWHSLGEFTWDLTTCVIEEDFSLEYGGERIRALESIGLKPPIALEEFAKVAAAKRIHPTYAFWYESWLNRETIKELTKDGPINLAFERRLKDGLPGPQYARYNIPIVRDPKTGHLMGYGTIHDVSNRYQLLAPVEYNDMDDARQGLITSLQRVFLLTYYFDLETDTFSEFVSTKAIRAATTLLDPLPSCRQGIEIISRFICEDDRATFLTFLDLDTLDERIGRLPYLSMDAQLTDGRWIRASLVPNGRDVDGHITSLVTTAQDISEDKNIQQDLSLALVAAEQANEAKSVFLNSMSHDIRTPMNAIIGFARMLEQNLEDPVAARNNLSKIQGSAAFLLDILNNILDIARIDSGKVELDKSVLDLEGTTTATMAMFDANALAKDITLEAIEDIENRYVLIDDVKFGQIVTNILSNAIKYTPAGGKVTYRLSEVPCNMPGCATYESTITDTGIGMSPEYLETIFDSFTRERDTTQSKIHGTGLGMAIVKKLVDAMGGDIRIESAIGFGTTVTVTLTHKVMPAPEEYLEAQTDSTANALEVAGRRVLLAEDNDLNAEIATFMLHELGVNVERACDGVEAVSMVDKSAAGHYDLILMDVQMPLMDGYAATQKIRRMKPEKSEIPIIAITANAFAEDLKKCLDAGMDDHIAKPVEFDKLTTAMQKALGK